MCLARCNSVIFCLFSRFLSSLSWCLLTTSLRFSSPFQWFALISFVILGRFRFQYISFVGINIAGVNRLSFFGIRTSPVWLRWIRAKSIIFVVIIVVVGSSWIGQSSSCRRSKVSRPLTISTVLMTIVILTRLFVLALLSVLIIRKDLVLHPNKSHNVLDLLRLGRPMVIVKTDSAKRRWDHRGRVFKLKLTWFDCCDKVTKRHCCGVWHTLFCWNFRYLTARRFFRRQLFDIQDAMTSRFPALVVLVPFWRSSLLTVFFLTVFDFSMEVVKRVDLLCEVHQRQISLIEPPPIMFWTE